MVAVEALVWGVLVATGYACLVLWIRAARRMTSGQEILPYESRRAVPWTAIDVAWVGLVAILLQAGCAWILLPGEAPAATDAVAATDAATVDVGIAHPVDTRSPEAGAEEDAADEASEPQAEPVDVNRIFAGIAGASLGNILALAVAITWLRRHGADNRDLGWDRSHLRGDLWLGAAGFAMASVPVLVIQGVLSQFFKPSHPVTDVFAAHPGAATLAMTAIFAVIIAPVAEEFFFRAVLQGWLESRYQRRHRFVAVAASTDGEPRIDAADAIPGAQAGGELAPAADPTCSDIGSPVAHKPRMAPVIISSTVFAFVHWDYGPSWVPLFFFALMLGYLYRQTHRLWPSVVAHACLNGLSTLVMLSGGG